MGDEEVKYMDISEFRGSGYLQEINRRFLHPMGLALEFSPGWDSEDIESLLEKVTDDDNDSEEFKNDFELLARAFEEAGLTDPFLSGVWDYRSDPEGIRYEGEYLDDLPKKALYVTQMWRQRKRARVEALRYMVQPSGLDGTVELGSSIVEMLGRALGEELHSAIGVKATSESWVKAAKGALDKLSQAILEEDYLPDEVTAEEVHVIDLLLMPESVGSARTRVEAVNIVIDRGRFYKEAFETASAALACIAKGDLPPGKDPQETADMALSDLAGMLG